MTQSAPLAAVQAQRESVCATSMIPAVPAGALAMLAGATVVVHVGGANPFCVTATVAPPIVIAAVRADAPALAATA